MSSLLAPAAMPARSSAQPLYILDAANRVEQRMLQDWLQHERPDASADSAHRQVVVPLADGVQRAAVQRLAEALQVAPDTPIVPLGVVWSGSVALKGTAPRLRDLLWRAPDRPGAWQARRILRKDPARARCIAAEPATLEALRQRCAARRAGPCDAAQLAEFVAGQAALALHVAERRLRGSRYKVPRGVAEDIRANPRFKAALEQLGKSLNRPVQDLRVAAGAAMKELIATPQTFWLDVTGALSRKIASLGYEPQIVVDRNELERVRQMTREHPSVLLFTHKTHVDAFALHSVLFDNDFPPPHVLGGINMAFAGLGFMGRRANAIFIRRSFQDAPVYKLVLRQYLGHLLEKRFPISWAFEGTRSRVGKLMPPRYGLLKYVIESAHASDTRNLHIIPVAINYDLIGDVRDYAGEQAGKVKTPESLSWFVGYLRGLREPMGRIYLDFGKPVVLDRAPSGEDSLALARIAFQVGVRANRVTPITLASLGTLILLGAAPRALTTAELQVQLGQFIRWARERGIAMTSHFEPKNRRQLDGLAEILVGQGLITRYEEGPEAVYGIAAEQHGMAGYYRNTIAHHFVPKAIAELALQHAASTEVDALAAFWAEAERLRKLFKFEFYFAPSEEFRDQLRQELAHFDPAWERVLAQEPAFAARLLAGLAPLVAHATLLPYVEAYRVAADVLAAQPAGAALSEKDCIARCLVYGRQSYLQRRISSEASIGKMLFENAYKLLAHEGLVEAGDAGTAVRRTQLSQDLRQLAHRIERIRMLALPA